MKSEATSPPPRCKACCAPGAYIEHTCVTPEGKAWIRDLIQKHGRDGARRHIEDVIARLTDA